MQQLVTIEVLLQFGKIHNARQEDTGFFFTAVADEGRLGRLGHRLFLKMGFQWSETRQKWQQPAFCLWPVGAAKCG